MLQVLARSAPNYEVIPMVELLVNPDAVERVRGFASASHQDSPDHPIGNIFPREQFCLDFK